MNIFIVAGDASGDKHAANLIGRIKTENVETHVSGLGGNYLKTVLDEFQFDIVSMSSFGFFEPLMQVFKLKSVFEKYVKKSWDSRKPDKVILVDYYGFNIHVAREAKKRGIPVYYFISPQVWASRPGRIKELAASITKMLVILPFEKDVYKAGGVDAEFVGHPLLDIVPERKDFRGPAIPEHHVIGLFPGSRDQIIKKHIPLLEKAAGMIAKEIKAEFKMFGIKGKESLYENSCVPVVYDSDYTVRNRLTFAITVSGTVSLENALFGIPMVVFYRLSWFNYLLAKLIVKVKYITMVNILENAYVVPELIQNEANSENIASHSLDILKDTSKYVEMRNKLMSFRHILGEPGVYTRAAKIILG